MARRAALRELHDGLRGRDDVCDAHPELVRAGANLGDPADDPCPVCDAEALRYVTYVFYRKSAKSQGGRVVARDQLDAHLDRHGAMTVYTVEVCTGCRWHHLLESFWLQRRRAG